MVRHRSGSLGKLIAIWAGCLWSCIYFTRFFPINIILETATCLVYWPRHHQGRASLDAAYEAHARKGYLKKESGFTLQVMWSRFLLPIYFLHPFPQILLPLIMTRRFNRHMIVLQLLFLPTCYLPNIPSILTECAVTGKIA